MAEELRLRRASNHEKRHGADAHFEKVPLEEALAAREQFLNEHPELRAYQTEIDRTLQNVIGFENRMAVLGMMLQAKLYQMKDAFLILDGQIKRAQILQNLPENRDSGKN